MRSPFRRLRILCEDHAHRTFAERLAKHLGLGEREMRIDVSPAARGSAASYVVAEFAAAVKRWRSARHGNEKIGLLVVIDGDKDGVVRRRNELANQLRDHGVEPLAPADPVAIIVPTWHIETWIAWLCGHRPIDVQTRYNGRDAAGLDVYHKLEQGTYTAKLALAAWDHPAPDESTFVPSLTDARAELAQRFGV